MKDFLKRLSLGAFKTAFRHYKDDTVGKVRKTIADRYESFVDKFAKVFRRLWFAAIITSFCSAGFSILTIGFLTCALPVLFKDDIIDTYAALLIGIFIGVVGLAFIILPILFVLALTRRDTVRDIFEVDDVRKKLMK